MASHGQRLQEARQRFFSQGDTPLELIDRTILRSWQRCSRSGLESHSAWRDGTVISQAMLKEELERNRVMLAHAQPVMEHVYEQIRQSGSMVVLADAYGLLLKCVGDAEFVDQAERVALQPGASWDEALRGTNAIGTALADQTAVEVFGGEHFFEHNSFLTCSAAPLADPQGRLLGVLDISGDYRAYQRHTLGLAKMSAQIIEKRIFESVHAQDILVFFHPRPEYLGSLYEGLLAVSQDGRVLAVNRAGFELLGLRRDEIVRRDFSTLFETPLGGLVDRNRREMQVNCLAGSHGGKPFTLRVRGDFPLQASLGRVVAEAVPVRAARTRCAPCDSSLLTLDSLGTGDQILQAAIDKSKRILGRDIPILVQGESGAGKEMFAKAFHNSGPRGEGSFVALNCAAIPESLIESELFGYQGGAFTGARKEGAVGKIQQAHGGTLFLDEIGDMPLHLQARLLRVLQERSVTPLGSSKAIPVDISLICATHRRLKDEVACGNFREDLYYRLHGLSVTLPALRERTDLQQLVHKLVRAEVGDSREVGVSAAAMRAFEAYNWPGNLRQLNNVIRVAIALLDDGDTVIDTPQLPDELFEGNPVLAGDVAVPAAAMAAPLLAGGSLEEVEQQAILRMLDAMGGNISAAARKLGISRNTLYRKIGRL
jgi:transcriptional regulator of acetoin/glycerol metabolism